MTNLSEADQIIHRGLPMTHESWRSKSVEDMTPNERRLALDDAEEAQRSAKSQYNDPPADYDRDDIIWAYEAFVRAGHRIKVLKQYERAFEESVVNPEIAGIV